MEHGISKIPFTKIAEPILKNANSRNNEYPNKSSMESMVMNHPLNFISLVCSLAGFRLAYEDLWSAKILITSRYIVYIDLIYYLFSDLVRNKNI